MLTSLLAAALLGLVPAQTEDLFLPYVACQGLSLDNWLDAFDQSGGRARKALWCVYYADDGSSRVREVLQRWYRDGSDDSVRADVLAILTHWGIAVEAVEPPIANSRNTPGPGELAHSTRPFSPPFTPLEASATRLGEALAGDDPVERARAAFALIRRSEDVARVVQTLTRTLFTETLGTWRGRLTPYRATIAATEVGAAN